MRAQKCQRRENEIDEGTYSLEGLGKKSFHRVGDYVVCKKIAKLVEICNWDKEKEWVIMKGEKLALARKVKYETLPKLDDIWSTERDYIINNVRLDQKSKVEEALSKIEKEGGDLLPSQKATKEFDKLCEKLENISHELVVALKEVKHLFIPEDPGEKFKFIKIPPVKYHKKKNMPETLSPLYARTFSQKEKDAIDQYISMGLKSGMLEPAPDSAFASPLLIVQKRADPENANSPVKYRLLIDSRNVNDKCLENTVFAAPNIEDAARDLGKGKFFSIFDIRSAFHRTPL